MISIVMTTYNGSNFINEQIDSILPQLRETDELIISDDGSTDGTLEVLHRYEKNDTRIKVLTGPGDGVISNYAFAITQAVGDIIFLADQDDVWFSHKVETIIEAFSNQPDRILLIMHNGIETDVYKGLIKKEYAMKHGVFRNIIKSSYYGHRIAFRKELISEIVPFPKNCPSYDQYIGLVSEYKKCSFFIEEKLTNHIIHEANWSHDLSLVKKVSFRIMMSASIGKFILKKVHGTLSLKFPSQL